MEQREEKVYYQDEKVTVTSARAIFGDKTYVLANVTSVSMFVKPADVGCAFWLRKKAKPLCFVRIGSASGETDAISSFEREYIQTIVDRLNQAIVERG